MLVKKIAFIHNQLSEYRNKIIELSSEFDHIEQTITDYNLIKQDLKLIKNNIKTTENNLNNINVLIIQELQNIKEIYRKIENIDELQELDQITLQTIKVNQLVKDNTEILNTICCIRTSIIKRSRAIKLWVVSILGTGALGSYAIFSDQLIPIIKAIFG